MQEHLLYIGGSWRAGGARTAPAVSPSSGEEFASVLRGVPNVILTPHIGGATRETLARGAQMIAEEIRRFAAGQPLVHVVNREALR